MLAGYQGPPVLGYGPAQALARGSFVGSTTPALLEGLGIKSIAYAATGIYTVTLSEKYAEFMPFVGFTSSDGATVTHEVAITAQDLAAGTFTFRHFQATRGSTTLANAGTTATFMVFVLGRVSL